MATHKAILDARSQTLIAAVAEAAGDLHINWMVTGATGRVLLLETVYGLARGRATEDVDLGVMVASWEQFRALVERICRDAAFQPDAKQRQRLRYRDEGILDLVPFGEIESRDRTIRWPPENDFSMSVIGFREAYAKSVEVDVDGVAVRVVDPAGLMLLKLVAWTERHRTQPRKDAADLAYLLRHFSAIVTEKVLFEQHFAAVEAADFDVDFAASRVLGQAMRNMAETDTRAHVHNILDDALKEKNDSALIREIAAHLPGEDEDRVYRLLKNMRDGFSEGAG